MTQKQAEYFASHFDARKYTEADAHAKYKARVKAFRMQKITPEEMDEIIGNYPDFPRDNE